MNAGLCGRVTGAMEMQITARNMIGVKKKMEKKKKKKLEKMNKEPRTFSWM